MMNQTRLTETKKDQIVFITIPTLNRTYCKVEQIQLIDIKTDLKSSDKALTIDPTCKEEPCLFLNMDNTDAARSVTFKIQYTITGGVVVTSPHETEILMILRPVLGTIEEKLLDMPLESYNLTIGELNEINLGLWQGNDIVRVFSYYDIESASPSSLAD